MEVRAGDGDVDELFAQQEWVRALALRLCGDASTADDLVQDTWIEALRGRTQVHSVRAWLGGIVRHRWRRQRERSAARTVREADSARRPELPSPQVLLEQAELQRKVLHAVGSLDEASRTVVLLRYYEGLSGEEIAARLGVPGSTVRNRLARAHEKLRGVLDREYGSGAWSALFIPAFAQPSSTVGTAVGVAMSVKLVGAGILVAAGCVLLWLKLRDDGAEGLDRVVAMPDTPPAALEPSVAAGVDVRRASPDQLDAPATETGSSSRSDARAAMITLHGTLSPADGVPPFVLPPSLTVTDHLGVKVSAIASTEGAYSIDGLAPGSYSVTAGAQPPAVASATIDLSAEEVSRQLDLELQAVAPIRIKVRCGEDKIWERLRLGVVATLESPGPWMEEVDGNFSNPMGVGQFWPTFSEDGIGELKLHLAPPVFVSLVHYQRVIATQWCLPGQSEIVFDVDPTSSSLKSGNLRLRVVGEDGSVITNGSVMLSGSGNSMIRLDKKIERMKLPPGWYELRVLVAGMEQPHFDVLIEPDVENDLGTIVLGPGSSISGAIRGPEEPSAEVNLRCDAFDPVTRADWRVQENRSNATEKDGTFRILGLSPGLYVLKAGGNHTDFGLWARVIDTRGGPVADVRIDLVPGVPLLVRPSTNQWAAVRFRVLDQSGIPLWSGRLGSPGKPRSVNLAPGDYVIEARAGNSSLIKKSITIADQPVELALP
jgi:RNA polymerase sigma-70 factor (ECF subfamily)